jgi:hypothetical protein
MASSVNPRTYKKLLETQRSSPSDCTKCPEGKPRTCRFGCSCTWKTLKVTNWDVHESTPRTLQLPKKFGVKLLTKSLSDLIGFFSPGNITSQCTGIGTLFIAIFLLPLFKSISDTLSGLGTCETLPDDERSRSGVGGVNCVAHKRQQMRWRLVEQCRQLEQVNHHETIRDTQ